MSDPNETWAVPELTVKGKRLHWTGPREDELSANGTELVRRVPPERWPYGPPHAHEPCCNLYNERSIRGGLYCDCEASAEDDESYGEGAWPTSTPPRTGGNEHE